MQTLTEKLRVSNEWHMKMLVVDQYVNVKFNVNTNGKMKKFMHDLVMQTLTEELM